LFIEIEAKFALFKEGHSIINVKSLEERDWRELKVERSVGSIAMHRRRKAWMYLLAFMI
jgi:hypothetical protein